MDGEKIIVSHHNFVIAEHVIVMLRSRGYEVYDINVNPLELISISEMYSPTLWLCSKEQSNKQENLRPFREPPSVKNKNFIDLPFLNFDIINLVPDSV